MNKLNAIILSALLYTAPVAAQDNVHAAFWSRIRIVKIINPQWEVELDGQYRRQDNSNKNIFSLPLTHSIRGWVYYHATPRLTIAFSPFAWFHNHALVTMSADKHKQWDEYRMYLYGEYRLPITRKLILFNRVGVEPMNQVRSWGNSSFVRLRWREQLNIEIKTNTQIVAGGELFLNSLGSESMNTYNQARGFVGLQHRLSNTFTIEGGYMFQHIQANIKGTYLNSHDLLIAGRINL